MAAQAVVYWANVVQSISFDFTFAPGITPSVCNILTVPHVDSLPNTGTLTFYQKDDDGNPIDTFEFPDCLLESPELSVGPKGNFWTLPILDRRWKWQWGWIDGSYNVPEPDGVSLRREKTPQELASLLLDAMAEDGYDVSRLPDDDNSRPHVEWSSAHPATELDTLCQSLDCIIVLNPLTNKVELWPNGDSRDSPTLPTDLPYSGIGYSAVYPAQPKEVVVEAGPTLFQATFSTNAVGLDVDGTWQLLEDLSYMPDGGWLNDSIWPPNGFALWVDGTYQDGGRTLEICDLADQTVFRCFKIVETTGTVGEWDVELLTNTDLEPQSLKDFRLFDSLAEGDISTDDHAIRPRDARAFANRWTDPAQERRIPDNPALYPHGFALDTVHGIITFPSAVFDFDESANKLLLPIVRVELSFLAGRDGVFHRHSVGDSTGSTIDTPQRIISRPEIQRRVIYRYSDEDGVVVDTEDNVDDVESRLNYWLEAALWEYGLKNGGTANYEYLAPLSPDGLIEQITWSGGTHGPKTTASAAQRHNRYVPPLKAQRLGIVVPQIKHSADQLDRALKAQADLGRMTIV